MKINPQYLSPCCGIWLPVCHPEDLKAYQDWPSGMVFECSECEKKRLDLPF